MITSCGLGGSSVFGTQRRHGLPRFDAGAGGRGERWRDPGVEVAQRAALPSLGYLLIEPSVSPCTGLRQVCPCEEPEGHETSLPAPSLPRKSLQGHENYMYSSSTTMALGCTAQHHNCTIFSKATVYCTVLFCNHPYYTVKSVLNCSSRKILHLSTTALPYALLSCTAQNSSFLDSIKQYCAVIMLFVQ